MGLYREEIKADSADVDDPMMNYNHFVDEVRKPGKRAGAMVIKAVTRKCRVHVKVFCEDPTDAHMIRRCAKEGSPCLHLWYSGSGSDAQFDWIKPNSENVMDVHICACAKGIMGCMEGGGPSKSSGSSSGSIYTPVCRHTTCELGGKNCLTNHTFDIAPGNFASTALHLDIGEVRREAGRKIHQTGGSDELHNQTDHRGQSGPEAGRACSPDPKGIKHRHQKSSRCRRHNWQERRGKRGLERVWTAH